MTNTCVMGWKVGSLSVLSSSSVGLGQGLESGLGAVGGEGALLSSLMWGERHTGASWSLASRWVACSLVMWSSTSSSVWNLEPQAGQGKSLCSVSQCCSRQELETFSLHLEQM